MAHLIFDIDNVVDCRDCILGTFKDEYKNALKQDLSNECENSAKFILQKNIIWGDALTLKRVDASGKPIIFSEWSSVNGKMMKRRDFSFSQMLDCSTEGLPLLSDLGDNVWLPKPVKEFPIIHYLRLEDAEEL
ncbi:MAG: hypothetical protein PHE89_05805 [Alphaproteobacteria bacterium]|nr:hypothetical protein [Alphaproteobacteria bacterium]